ncbi:hypothetical protein Tco_1163355 [Tanacetum coccineum]
MKELFIKGVYDIWVNDRQMQTTKDKVDSSKALDARLVDTESSGTTLKEQDTSSRSGNDAHADDADIRPIYDEEPMAACQTRAKIPIPNKTTKKIPCLKQTSFAKKPERTDPKKELGLQSKDFRPFVHEETMIIDLCLKWKPPGKISDSVLGGFLLESSELRIHDHSNEQSSSKLVPKVVPPADKTDTSRQELELLFHHHIMMLRSYTLSWKPCQGDSLNLPDHRIHKDGDGDALFQLKSVTTCSCSNYKDILYASIFKNMKA